MLDEKGLSDLRTFFTNDWLLNRHTDNGVSYSRRPAAPSVDPALPRRRNSRQVTAAFAPGDQIHDVRPVPDVFLVVGLLASIHTLTQGFTGE